MPEPQATWITLESALAIAGLSFTVFAGLTSGVVWLLSVIYRAVIELKTAIQNLSHADSEQNRKHEIHAENHREVRQDVKSHGVMLTNHSERLIRLETDQGRPVPYPKPHPHGA